MRRIGVVAALSLGLGFGGLACAHRVPTLSTLIPEDVAQEWVPPLPTPHFEAPRFTSAALIAHRRDADLRAHAFVQTHMHGAPLPGDGRIHPPSIFDPSQTALRPLYTALSRLERGEETRPVRIAVYGSSSVAIDRYTAYLRGYLQQRFGDGGAGFVATVPLWRWHRHNEIQLREHGQWLIEHAQRKRGKLDGLYGLLGASAHTTRRASTEIEPRSDAFTDISKKTNVELAYLKQPDGGTFDVYRGSHRVARLQTNAHEVSLGVTKLPTPTDESPWPLTIRTRGDGEVRLFGMTVERAEPGVVVDSLGIAGTRAANMLSWAPSIWEPSLQRRNYDMVILAYGANEAVDEDEPMTEYQANLRSVILNIRSTTPDAGCLMVGPVDFRQQTAEGRWVERPRINAIIRAQRAVAVETQCGFWDARAWMGEPEGMNRWVEESPALAKTDHLHLTTRGYLYLGRDLTDAIMSTYDTTNR